MTYLVLRRFKSFGVWYNKGEVVEATRIRSVRLKVAEGKIVQAPTYAATQETATTDIPTAVPSSSDEVDAPDLSAVSVPSDKKSIDKKVLKISK